MIKKNIALSVMGRLSSVATSFFAAIFCSRLLGLNEVSFYFWISAAAAFVSIVMSCGLGQTIHGIIRVNSNNGVSDRETIAAGYSLIINTTIFFMLAIVMVLIVGGQFYKMSYEKFFAAFFCGLFLAISTYSAEVLRHDDKHILAGLSSGLYLNSSVIILVILKKYFIDLNFIFCIISCYALNSLVCLHQVNFLSYFEEIKKNTFKMNQKNVFITVFIGVCSFIIMQSHTFFSGIFLSDQKNANFSVAAKLAFLMLILPPMLHQASSKEYISGFFDFGAKIASGKVKKMTLVAAIGAAPIFFAFFIFPEYVITNTFGVNYVGAKDILQILSIAVYLNIVRGPCGSLLVMLGFSRDQARLTMVCVVIILTMILISCYLNNEVFLAYSVLIGVILQGLLEAAVLFRKTKIRIY